MYCGVQLHANVEAARGHGVGHSRRSSSPDGRDEDGAGAAFESWRVITSRA